MSRLQYINPKDLVVDLDKKELRQVYPISVITESGENLPLTAQGIQWLAGVLRGELPAWWKEDDGEVGSMALMIPNDVAQIFGVTRQTIYTWQDQGKIGRVDIQGVRYVPELDVIERKEKFEEARRIREIFMSLPEPTEAEIQFASEKFSGLSRRLISRVAS